MKIVRVAYQGEAFYGAVEGDWVIRLNGVPYEGVRLSEERFALDSVMLLPPCEPTKIVAVGLNYKGHGEELGFAQTADPVIFLKPISALLPCGGDIVKPKGIGRLDYEAELGVVIGKECRHVPAEKAKEVIFGYTCVNDVTARDIQSLDGQWTRAKGYDTFAPVGPWIETEFDPCGAEIGAKINGEIRQHGNTANMIHSVEELIAFVSRVMTLHPGDMISTGTPTGVGEMHPGETVEIYIEGIGALVNRCTAE